MSVVDDYGRFDGRASILRASLYPLQLEKVTESDVEKWLLATEKAALVRLYQFDGKRFVEMQKFGQRVRSASKWPAVDSSLRRIAADCGSRTDTDTDTDLSSGKEGSGGKGADPPVADVARLALLAHSAFGSPPNYPEQIVSANIGALLRAGRAVAAVEGLIEWRKTTKHSHAPKGPQSLTDPGKWEQWHEMKKEEQRGSTKDNDLGIKRGGPGAWRTAKSRACN